MNGDTAATATHAADETRTALARAQSNSNHDDNFEQSAGAHNPRATKDDSGEDVGLHMPQHGEHDGPGPCRFMAAASLSPRRPNLQNNHISKQ